jgi:hypothetical protein
MRYMPMLLILALAPAWAMPISFTLAREGKVSLAVYDAQGRQVRTLLTGVPRRAGRYTETWDGLDRYGNPAPAGTYTWKLLTTRGLQAEFITQVGQNPDPVWERGVCNHAAPDSCAIDATGLYRIGSFDEGAHFGVKTDLAGKYLWTTDRDKVDPWCNMGAALALLDGTLYELVHDGTVYRYNARTGQCYTAGNGNGLWNLRWAGDKSDREYTANMDMDADTKNHLLVASYTAHDGIGWFDAKDGRLVDTATGIPQPTGIAVTGDGTVLVISHGAVLALTREQKMPKVLIPASKLQNPWRLSVNSVTGDIWVAENSDLAGGTAKAQGRDVPDGTVPNLGKLTTDATGHAARHHQVKRFARDGTLVRTYGKPEGRADGKYLATDFRGITDIAADPAGGFVVTEGRQTPPRRTARFDANGAVLREWYGAQEYGVLACPEPDNPQYVWFHANAPTSGMVRCKVDYQQKRWEVVETYYDTFLRTGWGPGGSHLRAFLREGRLYLTCAGPSALSLMVYDRAKQTLRLCNTSNWVFRDNAWHLPAALRPTDPKAYEGFIWNDLNDDGLPTADEIVWMKRPLVDGSLDPRDLSLFTTPTGSAYSASDVLTPTRITAGGTPVYAYDGHRTYPNWNENGEVYPVSDILHGDDGWYACFSDAWKGWEWHGVWYYNSCSGIDRLVKWDKNGQQLWSVGRHSCDPDHEIGSQAMPRNLVGLTHGCVIWADASDEEVAQPTVWTTDGLYVDEIPHTQADTTNPVAYGLTNANEYAFGNVYTDPKTGEVYLYCISSAGGSPIYRITGWDGWQRQTGTVTLDAPAPHAAKKGTGLKAEYFNNLTCDGAPVLTRTDADVYVNWAKGSPDKAVNVDNFSCRWTGQVWATGGRWCCLTSMCRSSVATCWASSARTARAKPRC